MEQRTCNIIMICKNVTKYDKPYESVGDAVKRYMGEECGTDWTSYSDRELLSIMESALFDYIDGCNKPSSFLRDFLYNPHTHKPTTIERLVSAFRGVRVRECKDGACVYTNDFTEEQVQESRRILEIQ